MREKGREKLNAKLIPLRFVGAEEGATTVQQAILIALVIGGAILALDGLGLVASKTFSTTSRQLSGDDVQQSHHAAADHAGGAGTASPATVRLAARPSTLHSFGLRLFILLVACPLGALFWYLLSRKEKAAVEDESHPPAPQSDSQIERDLVFDKRHNLLRLFNGDIGMLMTSRIMVKHVMSEKVHSVLPNTPVEEIQELMRGKKIRHVLVCDKLNQLLGLVTVRSVEDASDKQASEVMASDPPVVNSTGLLNPAITQIIKQRLYCLPVVDDGQLVGVLTSTDVMLALQCTLHALQKSANEVAADLPEGMVPGFMVALNSAEASKELVHG